MFNFRKKKENIENILTELFTKTEVEFETKLRKLGFSKINEDCVKLGFWKHKGSAKKMQLGKLIKKLSRGELIRFTNDFKPYENSVPKNPPIYFYLGDFFVSLSRNKNRYFAYYINDCGYVRDMTCTIFMNHEEISYFLGNLNDGNIKKIYRERQIEKLLYGV